MTDPRVEAARDALCRRDDRHRPRPVPGGGFVVLGLRRAGAVAAVHTPAQASAATRAGAADREVEVEQRTGGTGGTDSSTGQQDEGSAVERHETPVERLDRNWNEILQELRVTQTGIQILTGFLLTVPFQQRFADLTADQREIYLVLVGLAATTTALLVAPVSLHRILFRRHAKSVLVSGADRLLRVGLVFLALTVSGVVLLVFDVVVGRPASVIAASAILALLVGAWFVLPTVMGRRAGRATRTGRADVPVG